MLVGFLATFLAGPAVADDTTDPFGLHTPILVVLDTSGSMNEQVPEPETQTVAMTRIMAARAAVLDLVGSLGAGQSFGLIAYPGRNAPQVDGCSVGRVEVTPGALDVASASAAVRRLEPDGETPTGPALQNAADQLRDTYGDDTTGVIVLVSDGESNCGDIPVCDVAKQIRDSGLDVQVNTVGLELEGAAEQEMQCIADATGGRYIDVAARDNLTDAINESAHGALSVQATAPDKLHAVAGTSQDGLPTFTVALGSTGRVTASDVRVSLVISVDGNPGAVLVPRPVRFLGNVDTGTTQTVTFAVRPEAEVLGDVTWTVTATARNASPAIVTSNITLSDSLSPGQLGGVLEGVRTVAVVGDSYSSGEGGDVFYQDDTEGFPDQDSKCHRTANTYAGQIWGEKETTIIACSGAVTADFFAPDQSGDMKVRPQLLALRDLAISKSSPDAVFLTIGGNDAGFGGVATRCVIGARCDVSVSIGYKGVRTATADALENAMAVLPDVTDVIRAVDAAVNDRTAQRARGGGVIPIIVLPYPQILPETLAAGRDGCVLGLGTAELALLNGFENALNAAVTNAAYTVANEDRPVYVVNDVVNAFQPNHTACEGGDLSFVNIPSTAELGSSAVHFIDANERQQLLHPTADGYAAEARTIIAWSHSNAASEQKTTGTPVWSPQVVEHDVSWLDKVFAPGGARTQAGGATKVDADGFLPETTVIIRLHSSPRVLGTVTADKDGHVTAWERLPAGVPTGQHTLIAEGSAPDGTTIAVTRTITVMPQGGPSLYAALLVGVLLLGAGLLAGPWRSSKAMTRSRS
ncbi:VWA domain-containing protein [Pengzhenrongella sicca]|uniref:VWA domain-containing protein n=1 Tax=Pengzhenrongella sicca TaxID=2819238 RepID=A0A8A4ZG07_9MICO|nr:VWA domain-containing protein [Pengzhenrongella sicca]QTE30331.1 VWA domain-containing protein [Pengzhenrongella sicca]